MNIKIWAILSIAVLVSLVGCEAMPQNIGITADGKTYQVEVKEVSPVSENISPPVVDTTNSVHPPVTKYLITGVQNTALAKDGEIYLTNAFTKGETLKLEEYWVKENGVWVYHDKAKDLPLNYGIQSYPNGGKFGVKQLTNSVDWSVYIEMADGTTYVMKTGSKVIPIDSETIGVFNYYVREKPGERWYYHEGTKELSKKDARIL